MQGWLMFGVTAIVTSSLMMHMSVIVLQTTILVIESAGEGAFTRRFFYPELVQNVAIVVALLGFSFANQQLQVIAALLLALGILTASGRPHPTYRTIELPLVASGLLSLIGIGVVRFIA
ncbi:MAG: hypothetical protein EXQ88_02645 [Alphaproteobacteria bacterium]|nr:hypothetical protein [Alphaproteobacteria bacterium]